VDSVCQNAARATEHALGTNPADVAIHKGAAARNSGSGCRGVHARSRHLPGHGAGSRRRARRRSPTGDARRTAASRNVGRARVARRQLVKWRHAWQDMHWPACGYRRGRASLESSGNLPAAGAVDHENPPPRVMPSGRCSFFRRVERSTRRRPSQAGVAWR
jgi:hypothetical protein